MNNVHPLMPSLCLQISQYQMQKRQNKLKWADDTMKVIIDIIKFICITSTEIQFNNKTFKQIKGLRMKSSLSPILADFVMEDLLDRIFAHIDKTQDNYKICR